MNFRAIGEWLIKHKWFVATVLVIVAGYTIGKEMALRDNAEDDRQAAQTLSADN